MSSDVRGDRRGVSREVAVIQTLLETPPCLTIRRDHCVVPEGRAHEQVVSS